MKKPQVLTAYFSHSGNTRAFAREIHNMAGGDIFEIVPATPYAAEYDTVVDQARKELDSGFIPRLKTTVADMDSCTLVLLGYPNWWGTVPRPVAAFLTGYDFAGKTVAPFCTHGGGGIGRSVADIRNLCPKSTVPDGLALPGGSVDRARDAIARWLMETGITVKTCAPGSGGTSEKSHTVVQRDYGRPRLARARPAEHEGKKP